MNRAMLYLIGLVVANATAEQEVMGSIPGSDKRYSSGFFHQKFLRTESGYVPADGNRLAPYLGNKHNWRNVGVHILLVIFFLRLSNYEQMKRLNSIKNI